MSLIIEVIDFYGMTPVEVDNDTAGLGLWRTISTYFHSLNIARNFIPFPGMRIHIGS